MFFLFFFFSDEGGAAHGLKDVSQIIKDLSGFGRSTPTTTLSLSGAEIASLREVFNCKVWYSYTVDQHEHGM